MKILKTILFVITAFTICMAQVDSTHNKTSYSDEIKLKPNEYLIINFDDSNIISQNKLIGHIPLLKNSIIRLKVNLSDLHSYPILYNNLNTSLDKKWAADFSNFLPKDGSIFSIQYALVYGLYSDNKVKRWNCIR